MLNAIIVHSLLAALPCTLMPGPTQAVVRVERDTTLAFGPSPVNAMSASRVGPSAYDSLLATSETQMPAGRVSVLQLDSVSRSVLAAAGIRDAQPVAFVRAAPYRADCRVIRWTDTVPFVTRGEVGYVRGMLAPREQWISGVPVIVIANVWEHPYPRRGRARAGTSLLSAEDMFRLNTLLETWDPSTGRNMRGSSRERRESAIAWAKANPVVAELEPARSMLREAILAADWGDAERAPSRLRGTYRVDVATDAKTVSWYFRTYDRPGYVWRPGDSLYTTAGLIASPYVSGYRLVGHGTSSVDSVATSPRLGGSRSPLVWMATNDRPTAPNNDARRSLSGTLEFTLAAVPESLWDLLEPLAPRPTAAESTFFARTGRPLERHQKQPQMPLTLRLDDRGGVSGDASVVSRGKTIRITLQRLDTVSVRRPW